MIDFSLVMQGSPYAVWQDADPLQRRARAIRYARHAALALGGTVLYVHWEDDAAEQAALQMAFLNDDVVVYHASAASSLGGGGTYLAIVYEFAEHQESHMRFFYKSIIPRLQMTNTRFAGFCSVAPGFAHQLPFVVVY